MECRLYIRYKWIGHKIKSLHVCLYLWVQEFDPFR